MAAGATSNLAAGAFGSSLSSAPEPEVYTDLVSILVPVRDEEKYVGQFLRDVTKSCQSLGLRYELVVLESGSTDRTAEIVREWTLLNEAVRLVHIEEPGYGLALIHGINLARGSSIVMFNVDLWDASFLRLAKADVLGFDVISGSKLLPRSSDSRPLIRRVISRTFNAALLQGLLGYRGSDTHGIKIFRAASVLPVLKECVTTSDIFDTELMIRCERANLKLLEIPVSVREIRPTRFSGSRILRIPRDIVDLVRALGTRWSRRHAAGSGDSKRTSPYAEPFFVATPLE